MLDFLRGLQRNGFYRSVAELELVAGIWGDFVRGEDRNLNGRMDPNENDGELFWVLQEPGSQSQLCGADDEGGAIVVSATTIR